MQILREVNRNDSTVKSLLWTKVHDNLRRCRRPFVLSSILTVCPCHLLFKRYLPLSLEVVENRTNVKVSWPPFFLRDNPNCSTAGCWRDLPSAVWQSVVEFCLLISVCEASKWSRKQKLHTVGKNGGPVWSRLLTKVHDIWGRCRRPIVVVNALNRLSISCFVPKI